MVWTHLISSGLLGLLAAILAAILFSKNKSSPKPPSSSRTSPSSSSRTNRPSAPIVRGSHPSSPARTSNIPAPKPRRASRTSGSVPPPTRPIAQNTDPTDPRDFPICPICAAGNDLGPGNVVRIGRRRYRCIAGHQF